MTKKVLLWLAGTIAAAIIGWLVVSFLDGSFKPLTEEEILQLMHNARRQNPYFP